MAGAERLPVKTPGRLIAVGLDNAGPAVLQGFWLPEAELEARLATLRGRQPCPLTDTERAYVLFALDHLGGEFKQQVLYLEHKGGPRHMSYRQLCKLTKAWELRGWLTAPADAVSARRVTPELIRLAGLDQGA